MTLEALLQKIETEPQNISFQEVIEVIDTNYDFTPTSFKNGETSNQKDKNNGSCKIFGFAKLHQLDKDKTLNLFGDFYRKDVLENPTKDDHANIRNFIKFGWDGIEFETNPLK